MKTSISTFVHYRFSLSDAIRRYSKLGYDQVEIWGGRPHGYWEDMNDTTVAELRNTLEETGLSVSAWIPAQFRYPTNLASPIESMRIKSVDYLKRNFDVASAVNAPYVSVCPGFSHIDVGRESSWKALIRSLDELIEHAGKASSGGPKLMMEPANRWESDLVATVDDALRLFSNLTKPDEIGLVVDTGHCHINQEPLSDIPRILSGRDVHYHIDDNRGTTDDHLVPGEGCIDFSTFLSNLADEGYSGALTVELGFAYTVDPDAAAARSLRWLRDNIPAGSDAGNGAL